MEAAAALQLLEVVRDRKAALSGTDDARGRLLADEADPQFTTLAAAHPGLVADAAPFTPEDFDAALAALVGGIARDEYIAFHFTDGASVGYILADDSLGLRASQVRYRSTPFFAPYFRLNIDLLRAGGAARWGTLRLPGEAHRPGLGEVGSRCVSADGGDGAVGLEVHRRHARCSA